jgi:hypothetical protein
MEVQLWESQQEAEKQPHKLQEQMEKIVLEGNNARASTTQAHNRVHKDIS